MLTLARRLGITALTAVGLLGLTALTAQAQVRVMPNSQSLVNPFFRVAPGLPLNQAAFNVGTMGQALQQVPPWAFGFNPFPSPIITPFPTPLPFNSTLATGSFGGFSGTGTLYSAGGGFSGNSFSSSPFGGGYGGFGGYGGCYGGGYGGFGGFGGYGGYGCIPDPFAGYMSGAAQIIGAQSQFMTSQAQAEQTREQTRQMRIDTHRRILEEWQYERNLLANVPDTRIQEQKFALNRALNDPPLTEILTGDALNAIANNIVKLQNNGAVAPQVPLDDELLRAVNFSDGEPGNIGLLKNGGKLNWPSPLQGAAFDEGDVRKRLSQLAQEAVERVKFNGTVDQGTLQQMRKDAQTMHERLNEQIRDLTPTQYVDAKRFLNQLDEALRALDNKKVQNHFNGKWTPKAKTANELVKDMKDAGLKFAAATQGDETAYRMIQQRLTALNVALESQTASAPAPKP